MLIYELIEKGRDILYNIYCDESCHLENDGQKAMVLGAVWCPKELYKDISKDIINIKIKHDIKKYAEIKWTKVSPGKLEFYKELINYFFTNKNLHFRGLVIPDKSILDHSRFKQTHNDWYYKMYFDMLKVIIDPEEQYNIYLDIKDTNGASKVRDLKKYLSNNVYDFNCKIIKNIQNVRSEECTILQLADLLIGALGYFHREITTSQSKLELIHLIKKLSGYSLTKNTLYRESKFNLLIWNSNEI